MPSLSDFTKAKFLNLLFGGTAWSGKPATLYFALYTSAPTSAGGGTQVSGNGYARVGVTAGTAKFTVTANAVTNDDAITWPQATGNWGDIVAVGIFDAASGGNLLAFFSIETQTVVRGIAPSIAAGAFDLSLDAYFGDYAANKLLAHLFEAATFPTIATHYLALGTGGATSGVTGEHTIGNNGYTRASKSNNVTTWPLVTSGSPTKSNGVSISFPASTGAWASSVALTHFAIMDASSSGNCLWCGPLDQSMSVTGAGITPNFAAAADLTLTCE